MNKRQIFGIICVLVVLIASIAVAILFVQRDTAIDITVNAVKLDKDGNEISTATIVIQCNKLTIPFNDDRIELHIAPFDDLTSIQASANSDGKIGVIHHIGDDYCKINFSAWNTSSDNMSFCTLYFTKEFDCLAFTSHTVDGEPVYYVGSISSERTTREIVEYFNGLVPGL